MDNNYEQNNLNNVPDYNKTKSNLVWLFVIVIVVIIVAAYYIYTHYYSSSIKNNQINMSEILPLESLESKKLYTIPSDQAKNIKTNSQPGQNIEDMILFSHDHQQFAYAVTQKRAEINEWSQTPGEYFVIYNGKSGKIYTGGINELKMSSDGKPGYIALNLQTSTGNYYKYIVVVGEDEKGQYNDASNIDFSQDGKHWACNVKIGDVGVQDNIVLDGNILGGKNENIENFGFNTTSDKFAYGIQNNQFYSLKVISLEKTDISSNYFSNNMVYFSGKPEQIVFSSDGKQIAFVVGQDKKQVVLNSNKLKDFQIIDNLSFNSKDGNHLIYVGSDNSSKSIILDNTEMKKYQGPYIYVSELSMSADGNNYGYIFEGVGQDTENKYVMINDKITFKYPSVKNLIFSPDGKKIAFIAMSSMATNPFIVVSNIDGSNKKEIKNSLIFPTSSSMNLGISNLIFNSDGKKVIYNAIINDYSYSTGADLFAIVDSAE